MLFQFDFAVDLIIRLSTANDLITTHYKDTKN